MSDWSASPLSMSVVHDSTHTQLRGGERVCARKDTRKRHCRCLGEEKDANSALPFLFVEDLCKRTNSHWSVEQYKSQKDVIFPFIAVKSLQAVQIGIMCVTK